METNDKTVKITNCKQFACLVELMEKNANVAKGFIAFGSSKQEYNAAWDGFAKQLNSLGPPLREGAKWQKVRVDLKNKIKKKLGHNKKEISATGGGSNKLFVFSSLEESVISLLYLEKISPISNKVYGLEVRQFSPSVNATNTDVTELLSEIVFEETVPQEINLPESSHRKKSMVNNFHNERRRLLEDQMVQLKEQTFHMQEQTKYIREYARYTRKLFELKEKKFISWKEVQLEKRKHRLANTQYKIRALDYKERKLALNEQMMAN